MSSKRSRVAKPPRPCCAASPSGSPRELPASRATRRATLGNPPCQHARALLCAPTTLESTSLVAAVGLDLYLTRVAPAREFDRLNEDFNYVALIGSIVFLVAASFASQWAITRRDLNRAWK